MDTKIILQDAVERGASDLFVVAGLPIAYKINGAISQVDAERVRASEAEEFVHAVYELAAREKQRLDADGDDDFSFSLPGVSRYRASVFRQRGSLAVVVRVVALEPQDPDLLQIPPSVQGLADLSKGLVLVAGPAGGGKSTTLACMADRINRTRSAHVITLEQPLEYLHRHQKSIVNQREIGTDAVSYAKALRAALRQSPDVILLGEMRDRETISLAMTAAETGHLVLSGMHTVGAANTIERVIDAFPPGQQQQARAQLATSLQAVVCQQLVPTTDGGVIPAFEIVLVNGAIRSMIREGRVHQIDTAIYSGSGEGMISMDNSLVALYKKGIISEADALRYCLNPDVTAKKLHL